MSELIPCGPVHAGQTFARNVGLAFEVDDDSAPLRVRRGDILVIQPERSLNCDSLHLLRSGEIVRMQMIGHGMVRITRGDGSFDDVTKIEADGMVGGYVKRRPSEKADPARP